MSAGALELILAGVLVLVVGAALTLALGRAAAAGDRRLERERHERFGARGAP